MKLLPFLLFALPFSAGAVELHVGPQPLEHALVRQLFSAPDGRYYLRGNRQSTCFLYARNPVLRFTGNRIVLSLDLEGKVGREFGGQCFGFHWAGNGTLYMLPQAQGASIGFTDVRVEHLTGDNTVDGLLGPLIAQLAPRSIHVDAASLVGKMLRSASTRSGEQITLQNLNVSNMQVENQQLDLQVDGVVAIQ